METTSRRKVELYCGLATALLGLLVPFSVNGLQTFKLFEEFPELLYDALLLWILPGLLVAIGAYAHAVRQKSWGRVLLWIMAVLNVIVSPLVFLANAGRAGPAKAFIGLLPAIAAIATLLIARKVKF